ILKVEYLYTYLYMSKEKEYARLMHKSLEDNAHERNTYIQMTLDGLSDADKASDKSVLDNKLDIINDTFRGEVSAKLAILSPME
ncbi:MAG: hypothetical protein ACKPKO_32385, partial [Candidatus Fonsibacter sp.]